jgi:hypothetical protein
MMGVSILMIVMRGFMAGGGGSSPFKENLGNTRFVCYTDRLAGVP